MTRPVSSLSRREFLRAGAIAAVGTEVAVRAGVAAELRRLDTQRHLQRGPVKALVFDVFGTVVDWRTSVTQEVETLAKRKGLTIDAPRFADAWRAGYGPAMDRVRTGQLPWTTLDDLHRMMLDRVLSDFGIRELSEAEAADLTRAWHRLRPWPDVVNGLTRLKKRFIIAPLSNGNIALMTNLAKHAGLPWDCILGAELVRHYKPDREVYQSAPDILRLEPADVMMVAAHSEDLRAAKAVGLRTAFVARPLEFGPSGNPDLKAATPVDLTAVDFNDLATRLGA